MVGLGYYRVSKNGNLLPFLNSVFLNIISITLLARIIANKIKYLSF